MIIALSGYAQSGKDTVADLLVENHGFIKLGLNQVLREACEVLNPIVASDAMGTLTYRAAISAYKYEGAKQHFPEFREFMQRLGTEFAESICHPELWVQVLLDRVDPQKDYVLSSTRRWREAEEIAIEGGEIWRINRPGCKPVNDHPSETELDEWPFDYVINNDRDLDFLRHLIDVKMSKRVR